MKDNEISIAKGIAIVLMVIGHSGCPKLLNDSIYLFHMPLFFFIAGLTFKEQYLNEKKKFIINRIKRLLLPFLVYGLIYLFLHNLFYKIGFYETQYDTKIFFNKIAQTLTFRGIEQLLGGFWFLKVLFVSSILLLFYLYFTNILLKRNNRILEISILVGTIFFAAYINLTGYIMATLMATLLIQYSQFKEKIQLNFSIFTPIILVIVIAAYLLPISMFGVNSPLIAGYYLIISLVGILGILILSKFINKHFQKKALLIYIGDRTMSIFTFHLICLKFVSLLKIWHLNLPKEYLSDFPVITQHNELYWILYTIVGLSIPLILNFVLLKLQLMNKISFLFNTNFKDK